MSSLVDQVKRYAHQRYGVRPLGETVDALEQWLAGPVGAAIVEEERSLIDQALGDLYGFYLLQLGISRHLDLSQASTIHHRFAFTPAELTAEQIHASQQHGALSLARAEPERLPLASESIDVTLLHHVLEFTPHPHQVLRETARVMIPRGHLVVVGFNPVSWVGLRQKTGLVFSGKPQWRRYSLRQNRMMDWLRLLDFEPVSMQQGFFRWPFENHGLMQKTRWFERVARRVHWPLGGFYIIVARKEVVPLTPIKPKRKAFNPIEGLVGAQPTTRVIHQGTMTIPKKDKGNVA